MTSYRSYSIAIVLLLMSSVCCGITITVDDDGPADFSTIQDAIDWSWHGDTILVSPGTYNESIVYNSRAITLTSLDPNDPNTVAATIINGSNSYSVAFDFNEGLDSVLTGFTITGGGIQCAGTSPTIRKNIIRDCTAKGISGSFGAAPDILENSIINSSSSGIYLCTGQIYGNVISNNYYGLYNCDGLISFNTITENSIGLFGCDGSITDNTITGNVGSNSGAGLNNCNALIARNLIADNVSGGHGGGLYDCDGNILDNQITNNLAQSGSFTQGGGLWGCLGLISGNIISGNQAISTLNDSYGGGLYNCGGDIIDNQITGNLAQGNTTAEGGGLWGCLGKISENVISDNQAIAGSDCFGGGLYDCGGDILDNQITGNLAQSSFTTVQGGGLWGCSGAVSGNVISGNRAVSIISNAFGGGLYACGQIFNNTIVANQALAIPSEYGRGGGILNSISTRNNILAYNTASSEGGGIYGSNQNSYNLFWGNSTNFGGGAFAKTGDMLANPLFFQVGQWDDNGTPADYTDDIWTEGDYHLKSEGGRWTESGWVIDVVSSPAINAGDPADPVGNEPDPHGNRINVGAYGGTDQASKSPGPGIPSGIPGLVENFAVQGGHQQIEIDWALPLDTGNLPIENYKVYRGPDPNSLVEIAQVPIVTTTYIDTDIVKDDTYYYAVSAVNSFGEGPQAGPGSQLAEWHDFDLNRDGIINLIDFSMFSADWLWEAGWY